VVFVAESAEDGEDISDALWDHRVAANLQSQIQLGLDCSLRSRQSYQQILMVYDQRHTEVSMAENVSEGTWSSIPDVIWTVRDILLHFE